jgi:hypothetical protein
MSISPGRRHFSSKDNTLASGYSDESSSLPAKMILDPAIATTAGETGGPPNPSIINLLRITKFTLGSVIMNEF